MLLKVTADKVIYTGEKTHTPTSNKDRPEASNGEPTRDLYGMLNHALKTAVW